MPQIPGVPDLQPVDKPYLNPREAGKPGAVIADTGENAEGIADTGLDLEAHIREAQKHVDVIAAQNHMKALDDELQIELKKTTNSGQVKDVLDQYTGPNGKLNQVVKDFGKSPAAMEIQMSAQGLKPSMDTLGQARQLTLLGQENDANTAIQVKTLIPQIVAAHRSGDVAQEQQIHSHVEGLYDDAVKNGLMTAADKQLNMDAFREATQKQTNEAAITSANPQERAAAITQLKSGGSGPLELSNMTPAEVNILRDHAIDMDKHLNEQAESQNFNGALNIVANAVNAPEFKNPDGTPNFESIQTALHDGKWLQDHNLKDATGSPDRVMADKVAEQYEVQRTYHTQALADIDKKQFDSLEPRLYDPKKPLTENEIHQRALLPADDPNWISRTTESHLLTASRQLMRENNAINIQARMAMRQETEYDSAQILRELATDPGYLQSESELYQGEYTKLTKADRATAWAMKNVNGVKEFKEAEKMMSASSVYPQTDEGNAHFNNDLETLRKAVEEKHLVGSQITDEATKILHPQVEEQKKQTVKTLLDNIWPVAKSLIGGQPVDSSELKVPSVPVPESGTVKVPTSRKEYFNGMKKANPDASDAEINRYLDGKGIK